MSINNTCVNIKQWKKEQASCCCTADVCLRQSVNQLYNNKKMAKLPLLDKYQRNSHKKP